MARPARASAQIQSFMVLPPGNVWLAARSLPRPASRLGGTLHLPCPLIEEGKGALRCLTADPRPHGPVRRGAETAPKGPKVTRAAFFTFCCACANTLDSRSLDRVLASPPI